MQEGIVPAATNLSKLDDEDSMRACATVFALLSADPRGRAKFVQRKSALVSLFDLLRSTDQGTQVICGKVSTVLSDLCSRRRGGINVQSRSFELFNSKGTILWLSTFREYSRFREQPTYLCERNS